MKTFALLAVLLLLIGFASAGHTGLNYKEIKKVVNANSHIVPAAIADLFGDERINLHLEDGIIGMVTRKATIVELQEGEVTNPTMLVYTDTNTIKKLLTGELTPERALKTGKVRYKALSMGAKVKTTIVEVASSLYSVLTARVVQVNAGEPAPHFRPRPATQTQIGIFLIKRV